jgi:hypothetical protein
VHLVAHQASVSLSRAELSIERRTSRRAPSIPSRAKHPIPPNITFLAVYLVMRRAFRTGLIILFYPHVSMMHVIISRCFAARFGHVVNCVPSSTAVAKALATAEAGLALPPLG